MLKLFTGIVVVVVVVVVVVGGGGGGVVVAVVVAVAVVVVTSCAIRQCARLTVSVNNQKDDGIITDNCPD